jgi:arsenite methyltransferase
MELVISNCVVNLSPNKKAVLNSVYNVLKPGGEFYFSDVYCNRRLPDSIRQHPVLYGECLSGALCLPDFHQLCEEVGFPQPRLVEASPIDVNNSDLEALLEGAAFNSITFRLFKIPKSPDGSHRQQQTAVYKGTIPASPLQYVLDKHNIFPTNQPVTVTSDVALILEKSITLSGHFSLQTTPSKIQNPQGSDAVPANAMLPVSTRSGVNTSASKCCVSSGCC